MAYAESCKAQYIDEWNDDTDQPLTREMYEEWFQKQSESIYGRSQEYYECWWEDVFSNEDSIKRILHAIATNPAWWLSFLETRLKQEDAPNGYA